MTYSGHSHSIYAVACSPDGKYIASVSTYDGVKVWDAATGRTTFTYRWSADHLDIIAWSPDSQSIASCERNDDETTIHVWDASSGREIRTYHHPKRVNTVVWSPDGKSIASAEQEDETVHVWDVSTGNTITTYRNHSSPINSLIWSPDGSRIATKSKDTVHVSNATTGDHILTQPGCWTWSPDGTCIASGSREIVVQVWKAS